MSTRIDPLNDLDSLNASLDQAIMIASTFDANVKDQISHVLPADELTSLLYQEWYTRSGEEKSDTPLPQDHWAEVFRAAHQGTYRWESGWRASRVSTVGRVIAIRDEEERVLYPGDYISLDRPGLPPVPGTKIEAVSRRDSTSEQPGFWIAYSSTWENITKPILRLYFNISPEGAVRLATQISEKLADDIPYCLKLPVDSAGYQRADTAVLYFEGNHFERLRTELHVIYAELKRFLHPEVPALTKKLEPGFGLAEDPPEDSESFGLHRCRLIAEGFLAAKRSDGHDFTTMRATIINHFLEVGIDLARPHLNPGTVNDYDW